MGCEEYQLVWNDDYYAALATYWVSYPRIREPIRLADLLIAALLSVAPIDHAYHQAEGLYRLVVAPLAVNFSVNMESCLVFVTGLGLVTYPSRPD